MNPSASLIIPQPAYPYLVAQRGALDDMKDDPNLWCQKYLDMLDSEFDCIAHAIPKSCDSILDIGSGLGGIDALLNQHYGGDVAITLLDGLDDPPEVRKHSETFSNRDVARLFLQMNGVKHLDFLDANNAHRTAPRFYDLVISFKSWCFHYEAERYAEFVASCSISGQTKIIVDTRGGIVCNRGTGANADRDAEKRYETMRVMTKYFRHIGMLHYGAKFETHWFEAL